MSEHQPQDYRGNGEHSWEVVAHAAARPGTRTQRLRVPGGWLYKDDMAMVFVPMPEVVKHKV